MTFRIVLVAAVVLGLSESQAISVYDAMEVRGLQLLRNGSFEQTDEEAKTPTHWGVAKPERHYLRLVMDPTASKHGANFVTFAPRRSGGLWGRLRAFPKGKCRVI